MKCRELFAGIMCIMVLAVTLFSFDQDYREKVEEEKARQEIVEENTI